MEEMGNQVDWELNEQALHIVPTSKKHWHTKQVLGMCRVEKIMKIWGQRELDACSRCGEKESTAYMLAC